MALPSGMLFNMTATATASNVNGGGFNPANANFLTDGAITSGTGTSPVLSSASYSFVSGDVGAAVWLPIQTNIVSGFYTISSVSAGAATLQATIGLAVRKDTVTGFWIPSLTAGCATTASPTGVTFGVNYSMLDTAPISGIADFNAVGGSTTITSATANFTPVLVGNVFHQTTTGTGGLGIVGWYEFVSYSNATTGTLDRTPNTGTASVNTIGYIGGAARFGSGTIDDPFAEMIPASSILFTKSGTYVPGQTVSIASTAGSTSQPNLMVGYTSIWGDTCNGSSRPLLAFGANTFGTSTNVVWQFYNIIVTGSNTTVFSGLTSNASYNCKYICTRSASGNACAYTNDGFALSCEFIAQNGTALSATARLKVASCYIHDSSNGITPGNSGMTAIGNVFASCDVTAITPTGAAAGLYFIYSNTFYGRQAKIGVGFNMNTANASNYLLANNIFYGFTSGISNVSTFNSNVGIYNNFFNNTADTTNWTKSLSDISVDPQFVDASEITGATATTSGSVLTQSGGAFGIVQDNVDYLHVMSGTGVTLGNYLITSHTGTTLTVNNTLGTSSAGDVTYYITTGHNFTIGNAALKGTGYPNFLNMPTEFFSYPDIGAVQALGGASTGQRSYVGGG